ncbi:rhamnulokinase [Streptomyces canus]|uniref:rhamnulokinase n=1 Tax=Streptomyces canus TaxID=58343 RepID=UPI0027863508|nr:rhamnulokinase family protein [Streptomyces canus]MDQ0765528.1 rhamnulokinase [Streptomyces canus]
MSAVKHVAAVDLGAESGRVILGHFDGNRLESEEVHRFANGARQTDGALRWDVARIWSGIRTGLNMAAARVDRLASVGVDAWGLDYALLDQQGALVDDPVSHRDLRVEGALDQAVRTVGAERLYDATGTQLMDVNTVYQLLAERRTPRGRVRQDGAATLLMIPDLFHYLLSGTAVVEHTVATTSGAYDIRSRRWATGLLDELGIPTASLPEIVDPGTDLGPLLPGLIGSPALAGTRVITPAGHDTASAVVGAGLVDASAAYISSGTWSLVGVETRQPVLGAAARTANLSNEGGVEGTVRLLRNVMGMWILQECRRQWAREGNELAYGDLVTLASQAPPERSVIDPDDPVFAGPGDMPERIRSYCREHGEPVPDSVGEVTRCVLESLALRYGKVLGDLAAATGRPAPLVQVIGGGSRNQLLNEMTARAAGIPVHAGPVEAASDGNILVQLAALGELNGLDQMREVSRRSNRTVVHLP